jgi:hypothetical protein
LAIKCATMQTPWVMRRFFDDRPPDIPVFSWALNGPGHAVHFLESAAACPRMIGDFVADGILAGQPVIALVASRRIAGLDTHLLACGLKPVALRERGALQVFDAEAVVEALMVGGTVSAEVFRSIIGGALEAMSGRGRVIRVYGEAVDVLAARGDFAAAVQLEDLWNRMALKHPIALMCGYGVDRFRDPSHCGAFEQICGRHNRVLSAS